MREVLSSTVAPNLFYAVDWQVCVFIMQLMNMQTVASPPTILWHPPPPQWSCPYLRERGCGVLPPTPSASCTPMARRGGSPGQPSLPWGGSYPCRQGAAVSSVCSPPLHPLPPALGTAGLAHCTEGSTPDCLTVQVGYAVAKIKIWAHIVIWKRHEVLLKIRIKLPQCSRARNGIWIPGWHHWFFH